MDSLRIRCEALADEMADIAEKIAETSTELSEATQSLAAEKLETVLQASSGTLASIAKKIR